MELNDATIITGLLILYVVVLVTVLAIWEAH